MKAIQLSTLPRKTNTWYEKPIPVRISFHIKKSTVIILLLIAYIVFLHVSKPEINKATTYIKPISKSSRVSLVEPVRSPLAELAVHTDPIPVYVAPVVSGDCSSWLAQAGISVTYGVMELINGESGCNPHSLNASSGACGIGQDINGCSTYDPVAQLQWMNSYIIGRYGSWSNAYSTWLSRNPHWY